MPLYEVLTVSGMLDARQREELALGITAIHCAETGAPAEFVHVVFPEMARGHAFTAGQRSAPAVIRGQVRAGRPPTVRQALLERISQLYAGITGAPAMEIVVAIIDVPASWAMEGGRVFSAPDPDAERAWLAESAPPSSDR